VQSLPSAQSAADPHDFRPSGRIQQDEEKKRLEEELAELRTRIRLAQAKRTDAPSKFTFVPYDGTSGTTRRPILIECTATGIRFAPENVTLSPADVAGFTAGYNPMLAGANALSRYWSVVDGIKPDSEGDNAPYVLLIVRPGGTVAYYYARRLLSKLEAPYGYELLDDGKQLDLPVVDPKAKAACQAAVDEVLAERDRFIAEARSAGRSVGGSGAVGGSGSDPRGTTAGGAGRPAGTSAAGASGKPGGREVIYRPGAGFEVVESEEEPLADDPFEKAAAEALAAKGQLPETFGARGPNRFGAPRGGGGGAVVGKSPAGFGDAAGRTPGVSGGARRPGEPGVGGGTSDGPGKPTGSGDGVAARGTSAGGPLGRPGSAAGAPGSTNGGVGGGGGSPDDANLPPLLTAAPRRGVVGEPALLSDRGRARGDDEGTDGEGPDGEGSGSTNSRPASRGTSPRFGAGDGGTRSAPARFPAEGTGSDEAGEFAFGEGSDGSSDGMASTRSGTGRGVGNGGPAPAGFGKPRGAPTLGGSATGGGIPRNGGESEPGDPSEGPTGDTVAGGEAGAGGAGGGGRSGKRSPSGGGVKAGGAGGEEGSASGGSDGEPGGAGSANVQVGPSMPRFESGPSPRSRRWGVYSRRATIGFERTVAVQVLSDRMIVGRNQVVAARAGDSVDDVFEGLVAALDREATSWGRPPDSFYWVPSVNFETPLERHRMVERLRAPLKAVGVSSAIKEPPASQPARGEANGSTSR